MASRRRGEAMSAGVVATVALLVLAAALALAAVIDRGVPNLLEALGIRLIRAAISLRTRREKLQEWQRRDLEEVAARYHRQAAFWEAA